MQPDGVGLKVTILEKDFCLFFKPQWSGSIIRHLPLQGEL
jgi:hypothetical protein